MLSTVRIPVSLLEIDIPQKWQTPVNAELDVYAIKSQNETQFPERGALIYRKVALGAQGATEKKTAWALFKSCLGPFLAPEARVPWPGPMAPCFEK